MLAGTMHRVRVEIRGRVQNVGFRHFALLRGRALGLAGWVRNRVDGSVEVEAEGPREALEQLIEELRSGPPAASVEALDDQWSAGNPRTQGFEIKR
jgi:acylphosphatase